MATLVRRHPLTLAVTMLVLVASSAEAQQTIVGTQLKWAPEPLRDSQPANVARGQGLRRSIGLRAGMSNPDRSFDTEYDAGFNIGADVEFPLAFVTNNLAGQIVFGYNSFGSPDGNDLQLARLTGNTKWYFTFPAITLFLNAGGSVYWFDPGGRTGGTNWGGGVQRNLNPMVAVEGAYNMHVVATSGEQVSTYEGTLRFRF